MSCRLFCWRDFYYNESVFVIHQIEGKLVVMADKKDEMKNRLKVILRTSIIGIIVNVLIGVFKAIVGIVSNSIAITLDAVNNLTDAGSGVITIISTSFSVKPANKKHPFGYGRMEYLGTLLISVIILYAGITALVESVKGIFHHEVAKYSVVSIVIIVVAVVMKSVLAIYYSRVGKKIKSDSLVATAKEAIGDIAISISTIVAVIIFFVTGLSIEAWLGAIIALFIIKTGGELIHETVGKILGNGADASLVRDIKAAIIEYDQVEGAYDLVLNNYGPDSYLATVHIEVKDTMPITEFDSLSRTIRDDIATRFGVFITSVGVYSINTMNTDAINIREDVRSLVLDINHVKQMHGFYVDDNNMRFDVVISFDAADRMAVYNQVVELLQDKYPSYTINIGMDMDYNEI